MTTAEHSAPRPPIRAFFKRKRVRVIAIVLAVVVGLLSWITWYDATRIDLYFDDPLTNIITNVGKTGEQVYVRDMIAFEWDAVALFYEYTNIEEIESITGDTTLNTKSYTNSAFLLVFLNQGRVTHLVGLSRIAGFSGEFERLLGRDAMFVYSPSANAIFLTDKKPVE